jgi:hypothetical protein
LRAVVAYFRADPRLTLGQASAYFAHTDHSAVIAEALAEPLLNQSESPDFDIAAEAHDLVERLRGDSLNRRRSELTLLVEAGTATPEQKAEYGELLARLATSKSGNPVPEERSKL